MAKQNYYRLTEILKVDAEYYLLLGERSNGKSYAVKEYCLEKAWNDGIEFVYLRRWRDEIKYRSVEKYFDDMVKSKTGREYIKELTKGEWTHISVYQGEIFFSRYDGNKRVRCDKRIGHTMCLTGETHYKSLQFPQVENIIFEEFVTDKGYTPREPETLQSLVSTVLRRERGHVFCIGNTITQVNPFFNEWQLTNVPKMEQGTIDVYEQETLEMNDDGTPVVVRIAVEYCANSGSNSKMFFGRSSKMITSGKWDTKEYLHLERHLETYDIRYKMYYINGGFRFCLCLLREDNKLWVHIYPCTTKIPDNVRIVDVQRYSLKPLVTQSILHQRTKYDIIISRLIAERKITVSDNLTGTNFFQVYERSI